MAGASEEASMSAGAAAAVELILESGGSLTEAAAAAAAAVRMMGGSVSEQAQAARFTVSSRSGTTNAVAMAGLVATTVGEEAIGNKQRRVAEIKAMAKSGKEVEKIIESVLQNSGISGLTRNEAAIIAGEIIGNQQILEGISIEKAAANAAEAAKRYGGDIAAQASVAGQVVVLGGGDVEAARAAAEQAVVAGGGEASTDVVLIIQNLTLTLTLMGGETSSDKPLIAGVKASSLAKTARALSDRRRRAMEATY